jgi:CheY-like chemotaxis protein
MSKEPRSASPEKKGSWPWMMTAWYGGRWNCFLAEAGYERGCRWEWAGGARSACRKHFDLLITDIRMPGMDGLQVIQAVRDYCQEMKKHPIPEIVLTAYNDERVKESAERLGIRDFLMKPFKVDEFLKVLERYLGRGTIV